MGRNEATIVALLIFMLLVVPAYRCMVLPSARTAEELASKTLTVAGDRVLKDASFLRGRPLTELAAEDGWLRVRGQMQMPLVTDKEVLGVLKAADKRLSGFRVDGRPLYIVPVRAERARVGMRRVWLFEYVWSWREAGGGSPEFPTRLGVLVIQADFPFIVLAAMVRS